MYRDWLRLSQNVGTAEERKPANAAIKTAIRAPVDALRLLRGTEVAGFAQRNAAELLKRADKLPSSVSACRPPTHRFLFSQPAPTQLASDTAALLLKKTKLGKAMGPAGDWWEASAPGGEKKKPG